MLRGATVISRGAAALLIGGLLAGGAVVSARQAAAQEAPRRDVVVFAGDSSFPPYEYLDAEGRPAGFNVELVRALASQANVRVEIRLGVWRDMIAAFERGEVDLMAVGQVGPRGNQFVWLDRIWTLRQALAYRPGRSFYPTQIDELAGERIAVEERALMHDVLRALPEDQRPEIVATDSQLTALRLVALGEATAAAGNALTLQNAAQQQQRRFVVVDTEGAVPYRFVTTPASAAAVAWLGPALAALRESGRFHRLIERHLLLEPAESSWWDFTGFALVVLGAGGALMLGIIVWNRALRRQVEVRQSAVERTARLQTVTAALSEALTPADVSRVIVEQSVASLGAMAGVVALRSAAEPARLEIVYSLGFPASALDAWRQIPLEAPVPLAQAASAGEMVLIASLEELARRFPALAVDPARSQTRALAAVPLALGTGTLGVLGLSFATERRFSADDQGFLLALARQCAQALERARLFLAEKEARGEAEAASRAKDEFLATLSHELRTPINAIVGWTHMLRRGVLSPDKATRALETVERNARAQMQLINDLLDVSRAVRGTLHLDVQALDLGACLEAALETVRPAAEARRIALIESIAESPGDLHGDPARLQQVFWNLLSNALKFTPPAGRVEVALYYTPDEAVVRVTDSGVGIDSTRLPHVFERFYQGDASTTRAHGGLGLGLSIARHLVELHGGTVTAMSGGRNQGSTFTVRLPRRPARRLSAVSSLAG